MRAVLAILAILASVWADPKVCPPNWVQYKSKCYFFSNSWRQFDQARQICRSQFADLVFYQNADEQKFVEAQFATLKRREPRVDQAYWIGITDRSANKWRWITNNKDVPSTMTRWGRGMPTNAPLGKNKPKRDCVLKKADGKWYTEPCNVYHKYVCYRWLGTRDPCDGANGWVQLGKRCYKHYTAPQPWRAAQDTCNDDGATLLSVNLQSELAFISDTVTCRDSKSSLWIGLSDTGSPGTLKWTETTNAPAANEPKPRWVTGMNKIVQKGDTCVAVFPMTQYKWETDRCLTRRQFVCEKPQGQCPRGWTEWNGHCYQLNANKKKSFFEAIDDCKNQGAKLFAPEYWSEQQQLKKWLPRYRGARMTDFWIGVTDYGHLKTFQTYRDEEIPYKPWKKGYPKPEPRGKQAMCGFVQTRDKNAEWLTGNCFYDKPYICEIDVFELLPNATTPSPLGCPSGWRFFKNQCYYFSADRKNWNDAKAYCKSQSGATLATLKEGLDLGFVGRYITGHSYIGLHDISKEGRWQWDSDGSLLSAGKLINWGGGEPNNSGNEDCVEVLREAPHLWNDHKCTTLRQYVCQAAASSDFTLPTQAPTLPWSPLCGVGWNYWPNGGSCYKVMEIARTWPDARADCVKQGGDLVSIGGRDEETYLHGLLSVRLSGAPALWIGANDRAGEGGWRWSDGTPLRYVNWNTGEPNNAGGGEDCIEVSTTRTLRWNDYRCSGKFFYMCEKLAKGVTTTPPPTAGPGGLTADCTTEPLMSGKHWIQTIAAPAGPSYDASTTADNGRLKSPGGAWVPKVSNGAQYLRMDFLSPVLIKQVQSQGYSKQRWWVRTYRLRYRYDSVSSWKWYMQNNRIVTFQANNNQNAIKTNTLPQAVEARYLEIRPLAWQSRIAMRVEVQGCPAAQCKAEPLSSGPRYLPDVAYKASTSSDSNHLPQMARGAPHKAGARNYGWVPRTSDQSQYLQIDLGMLARVNGITTWGQTDNRKYFVKTYKLKYSTDGNTFKDYYDTWQTIKTFSGNKDWNNPVTNKLYSPINARWIRILPQTWQGGIGLRARVLGCDLECEGVAMIDGARKLPDSRIRASSSFNNNYGPANSRLNTVRRGALTGAWSSRYNRYGQYIQVDLEAPVQVKSIAIQGRQDYNQWVKSFRIIFSADGRRWSQYKEKGVFRTFSGNWDRNTIVKHWLKEPQLMRFVRVYPVTWQGHMSMRWEVYSCPGPNSRTYVGCFAENARQREFRDGYMVDGFMSSAMCSSNCYHKGFLYAGINYRTRCYCSNGYGSLGASAGCTYTCPADKSEKCGGPRENSVYTTGLGPGSLRCADGWTAYGDRCFQVFTDARTWFDAQAQCRKASERGDLVTIQSAAENALITSMVRPKWKDAVWVGLNDLEDVSEYQWSDGQPVRYTRWSRNEPNNFGNKKENCVQLLPNTYWNDEKCDKSIPYVCEAPKASQPVPTGPPPQVTITGCPAGWTFYNPFCYNIIESPVNVYVARQNCKKFGGSLVRVYDRYQQAYLVSQLSTRKSVTKYYWTDLYEPRNGVYRWTDGTSSLSYTNWGKNQPNPRTGLCVGMDRSGLWYDFNCGSAINTICAVLRKGFRKPTPPPTLKPTVPCEDGWVPTNGLNGYCFQVNDQSNPQLRLDWVSARTDCVSKGGDLAAFFNSSEDDYIWRNHLLGGSASFWIGLNDRDQKVGYRWSNGKSVSYVNWADNEPNDYGGREDCVELYINTGKWNDQKCGNLNNWICQIPQGKKVIQPTTIAVPTAGPPGSCPDGDTWQLYNKKCYYVSQNDRYQAKNWQDAEGYCRQFGGHLASIHSEPENNFLFGQTRNVTDRQLWIGLNELDFQKGYKWSDGSAMQYKNWAPQEPNDFGGSEMCVAYQIRSGQWNDEHCSLPQGFICEKSLDGSTVPPYTQPPPTDGGCPSGFTPFGSKCYKIATDQYLNWTEAGRYCAGLDSTGSLLNIQSKLEQDFVTSLMWNQGRNFWIGMRWIWHGTFSWNDGTKVTYTNWAPQEPNGKGKEACVELLSSSFIPGMWNDLKCDSVKEFICQAFKDPQKPKITPPNDCDAGFTMKYADACYSLDTSSKPYDLAEQACESKGGYLASITSPYEQAWINTLIYKNNVKLPMWIGLNDKTTAGKYVWTDGWPVYYSNWAANEPQRGSNEGCVQVAPNGRWSDVVCADNKPSVCKKGGAAPSATLDPTHNGTCPVDGDWLRFDGTHSCYLFMTEELLTLPAAQFECNKKGAVLLSIARQEELDFLTQTLKFKTFRSVWLGLRRASSGGWQWMDGEPVKFVNWGPNEPNNYENKEDCTEMGTDGKWNDIDCYSKRGYVCKSFQTINWGSSFVPPTYEPESRATSGEPSIPPEGSQTASPTTSPTRAPTTRTSIGTDTFGSTIVHIYTEPPRTFTPALVGNNDEPSGLGGGAVAGIVIAVLVILGLTSAGLLYFFRFRGKQPAADGTGAGFDNVAFTGGQVQVSYKASEWDNDQGNTLATA